MSKFTIRRRFPNYFSGFEETEHEVENRQDLESIDWVANAFNLDQTYSLAISTSEPNEWRPDDPLVHSLMTVTNYDEKFGGCRGWWVIGYIIGDNAEELDLPEWTDLKGSHFEDCPQKKNQHHKCECGFKL